MFGKIMSGAKALYRKSVEVVRELGAGVQALAVGAAVGLALMFSPGAAQAVVDPAVQTGVDSLVADAGTLGGIATGAVVAIMLIVLGIRLVKKILGRAV